MRERFRNFLELALNGLSVLSALFVLYAAGGYAWGKMAEHGAVRSSLSDSESRVTSIGRLLPSVDWSKHTHTAVLILRTDCPYCQKSLPLHRSIAELASKNPSVGVVAVFSEPLMQARSALELERLAISNVIVGDLAQLHILGTPTVLVVDRKGNLESRFDGFLEQKRASVLMSALDPSRPKDEAKVMDGIVEGNLDSQDDFANSVAEGLSSYLVSAHEVAANLALNSDATLLDIRSREDFATGHLDGAINIPREELEQRMSHEVDPSKPVYLYCTYYNKCENDFRNKGVLTSCTLALFMLKSHGFSRAMLITEDLEKLRSAGLLVSTRKVDPWR